MLTLQPRQRVGHDILLARHGNHICRMRLDRTNDRVIALLDDGTTDSAPNLISPAVDMPESFGSAIRKDWPVLVVAAGVMLAVSLAVTALIVGLAGTLGEAEMQQTALNYQNFAY